MRTFSAELPRSRRQPRPHHRHRPADAQTDQRTARRRAAARRRHGGGRDGGAEGRGEGRPRRAQGPRRDTPPATARPSWRPRPSWPRTPCCSSRAAKLIGPRHLRRSGPSGNPAPPSRKCCTTWAATWPSAPPTSWTSAPGSWPNCAAFPPRAFPSSATPFILVAEDLAPADTATLDPEQGPGPGHRRRRPAVPHRHHRPLPRPARRGGRRRRGRACRTAPRSTWTAPPALITAEPGRLPARRRRRTGPPPRRCWPTSTARARRRTATWCRCSPTSAAAKDAVAAAEARTPRAWGCSAPSSASWNGTPNPPWRNRPPPTRASSTPSRARRWSCARSTPARTSRCRS